MTTATPNSGKSGGAENVAAGAGTRFKFRRGGGAAGMRASGAGTEDSGGGADASGVKPKEML